MAPNRHKHLRSRAINWELIADSRELYYIFSVLLSYFTMPFLSFWRFTSSLV
jgi:hypothetical protein